MKAVKDIDGRPLPWLYPSTEDDDCLGKAGLAAMLVSRLAAKRIMRWLDGRLFWGQASGQSLSPESPVRLAIWSFADLSNARPVVDPTAREREVIVGRRGCSRHGRGDRPVRTSRERGAPPRL